MATVEQVARLLSDLSASNLDFVQTFIEFLKTQQAAVSTASWCFDFIENFREAMLSASRDPAGMEVKVADATCGGQTQIALWEHPPVVGSASVGYTVPITPGLRDVKLKFAIGIRDGAELPTDRFVAFRVLINGWKLWSTVKNSHPWEEHAVAMPQLGSDVARVEFVTDGLGQHQWDWAVWGAPRLEGESKPTP